ncbi:RNA polymerase II transcription mediator complex subunit 9-domain-containing protein [Aspergillus californicus]
MASRSPRSTAVTPAPKSSAPDTPVVNETPAIPQAVPFPSPQTFDFIPPLHGLILRHLSPQSTVEGGANGQGTGNDGTAASGQGQSQQQQTPAVGNDNSNAEILAAGPTSAAVDIAAMGSNIPQALDIKSLPTEVSSIKIRIQKAQGVVEGLPDVHRTVTEQEKEIDDLEDKIARLKSVISDFGRRANKDTFEKAKASGA